MFQPCQARSLSQGSGVPVITHFWDLLHAPTRYDTPSNQILYGDQTRKFSHAQLCPSPEQNFVTNTDAMAANLFVLLLFYRLINASAKFLALQFVNSVSESKSLWRTDWLYVITQNGGVFFLQAKSWRLRHGAICRRSWSQSTVRTAIC